MFQRVLSGALALAVCVLAVVVLSQGRELERLSDRVEALGEELAETPPTASAPTTRPRVPIVPSGPIAGNPAPSAAPRAAPPPRVAVSEGELAHVESALLNLLESDHPELREKLQAVVQEQQQNLQQQRREERRERWVARREARLLALSESAGITEDQRAAVLTTMLATRDQIEELRQNARTPEELGTLKARVRALRDQGDAQIRKHLTPAQYTALKSDDDDDDDDGPPRRPRPE